MLKLLRRLGRDRKRLQEADARQATCRRGGLVQARTAKPGREQRTTRPETDTFMSVDNYS
jgi:hypothetical protein